MSDPYIQNLFAERIGGANYGKGTAIFKFEKIKRARRAAMAANPGAELIDMGVGEPDEMAFPDVIDELHKAAKQPQNRGYADNGGAQYQQAAARWMKNVCGVDIADPANQIIHSIGSKAALSILPDCFINPGDVALMTTPGYPVFGTHAKYLGGGGGKLPPLGENKFFPGFDKISPAKISRGQGAGVNYTKKTTRASGPPPVFSGGGGV